MDFKTGNTVRLKSGGPLMTVSSVCQEDYAPFSKGDVSCKWFEGEKIKGDRFKPAMLEHS